MNRDNLRKVKIYNCSTFNTETKRYETIKDTEGYFHTWGLEDVSGNGESISCSVAIVELCDGRVVTVSPSYVQFID